MAAAAAAAPNSPWPSFPCTIGARRRTTLLPAATPPSHLSPRESTPFSRTTTNTITAEAATAGLNSIPSVRLLRRALESGNLDDARELYANIRGARSSCLPAAPGVVLESTLIDAFMKHGRVDDALWVFDEMPERNVVTWTCMISGLRKNGLQRSAFSLFVEMMAAAGVHPNEFSCNAVLSACADTGELRLGRQVHSLLVKLGFDRDPRSSSCLVDFYAKCGLLDRAAQVLAGMREPDLVAFTALITGFCDAGLFDSAVDLFDRLMKLGMNPNGHTITSMLTASSLLLGEQIHGYMIKTLLVHNHYASTSLLELYGRNSMLEKAKLVFFKMKSASVVTWSSMISCCLNNCEANDAVMMFLEMIDSGVKPNEFTFATIFGACSSCSGPANLDQEIHCMVIKLDMLSDGRVCNALLTMYAKSGEIENMEKVFNAMTDPDAVSWCSIISGYSQNECDEKAVLFLQKMLRSGDMPNDYGLSSVLSSCANLASLDQGMQFHCLSVKLGCDQKISVANALINTYSKCGSIDDVRLTFHLMPIHDLMSWNSLIHGYANLGEGDISLQFFKYMIDTNCFMPDQFTFLGVLVACKHMGYLDKALEYFRIMTDQFGITPSLSHYACLIDIMSRARKFSEAIQIMEQMPLQPDILIWKSLLGSCRLHKNLNIGRLAAGKVAELSPMDSAGYVLLSNLHAMHEEYDDADDVRKTMDARGVKKEAARSWIELKSVVHSFVAGDKYHPSVDAVFGTLTGLNRIMKN